MNYRPHPKKQQQLQELGNQSLSSFIAANEHLEFFLRLNNCIYWEQDVNFHFTLLKYSNDEKPQHDLQYLIGKTPWEQNWAPVETNYCWKDHRKLLAARKPFKEFAVWRADHDGNGESFMMTHGEPKYDENGVFSGYKGFAKDITAIKLAERYNSTIDLLAIGIGHVNIKGEFIHVNQQLCDMLGYNQEELLSLTVKQVSHPDDENITDEVVAQLRSGKIASFNMEKRYLRKDQTPIWVALTISVNRDPGGEHLHDIAVVNDISARKQAEERVQFLASHDEMTTLPNRNYFIQLLKHTIATAQRYSKKFAVLFIDLDRFKQINDSLGHEAGDFLLIEMAKRFKSCLRSSDIVARLGGDEFVVLVQEANDEEHVALIARQLLAEVIKPATIMGRECRVTASIGICTFPEMANNEQELMVNADIAMYLAKEEGKNTFQIFTDDIKSHSIKKLELEQNLRDALSQNEFSLHYQPRVNMKSGAIIGVEALIRWHSPTLGDVTPAQFIPIAEEMGLIVPLGKWVLRTACEQLQIWQDKGLPQIGISVNLSARQFMDAHLIEYIKVVLDYTGLSPELIELEITESMVIQNTETAIEKMHELKGLGVKIAIDDFGTGYSSLSKLKQFPLDTLKIDRSFIRELPADKEDSAITEAIIVMGKLLGLKVVAEGVETPEQQKFLYERSCDEIQGYYFSKPISPKDFEILLREYQPALRR